VEVATQSPVLGYQVAFQDTEGLQIDGSLAETTEAAYYILFAAEEKAKVLDPTWVQCLRRHWRLRRASSKKFNAEQGLARPA